MQNSVGVAIIGAGRMGSEHARRLHRRISGAHVVAVVDIDRSRADTVVADIPGAEAETDVAATLARSDVDAIILATPGFLHHEVLLEALAHDLPILCEKPLTPDGKSARTVLEAEQQLGRRRIQVGFMRRFDRDYRQLRARIEGGTLGLPLMLHCAHRNPVAPATFTDEMMIHDSVVHEFDTVRYLCGEEISEIQVRSGRLTQNASGKLRDPQQILMKTASGVLVDVEIFVNAQLGYQVTTQAVLEQGVIDIGGDAGALIQQGGHWGGGINPGFESRFGDAFDQEVQTWVQNLLADRFDGPDAWDGYAAAVCCEAGVKAQHSGQAVAVELGERPPLYRR